MTCMDVLINRFQEDITPRRTIARFALIATPIDSPDPRTLVQIPQRRLILPDAPLAIGSSQDRQSGHLEQARANVSERSMVEISESQLLDSILNDSELPSEVGSPTIVTPKHRKNKMQASSSLLKAAFLQAIHQSQEADLSTTVAVAWNSSHDDSLPGLFSPVVVNPRIRPKRRISKSIFKKAFESLDRESSIEDSEGEFPAELPSPENPRPPSRTRSRKYSGSQYQEVLNQIGKKPSPVPQYSLIEFNGSEDAMSLSDLSIDEIVARPQTFAGHVRKKVSMGAFTAVLNQQQVAGLNDSDSHGSIDDLRDELTLQRPVVRPKKRASSTLYKEVLSRKVNYKLAPSDVELSPVVKNSPIPISSSSVTGAVGSRMTNFSKSDVFDDSSSLDVQQPEFDQSKSASSSQQRSEEKANEQTSDVEEDGELHQRSAADKQRRSGSTGRKTLSSIQRQTESDGSLSGRSTLETPEFVKQRKIKNKPKVSSTLFDRVLEGKASASDEDLPPQKEKFAANRRRTGSSSHKTPPSNQSLHEFDSPLSGPSTLETPEQVQQPIRKNIWSRVSNTEFLKVLQETFAKAIASDEGIPTQEEKSRAKEGQSGSSGRKTSPSNKSHESANSFLSSPGQMMQPQGGVSSNRTPTKSRQRKEHLEENLFHQPLVLVILRLL